jgi:hypothetical protein
MFNNEYHKRSAYFYAFSHSWGGKKLKDSHKVVFLIPSLNTQEFSSGIQWYSTLAPLIHKVPKQNITSGNTKGKKVMDKFITVGCKMIYTSVVIQS